MFTHKFIFIPYSHYSHENLKQGLSEKSQKTQINRDISVYLEFLDYLKL